MENKVKISISSIQKQIHAEAAEAKFVTYGKMARYGFKYRISYEESELFGQPGVITTFVINQGNVSLERTGVLHSFMEFKEGSTSESIYQTEYGSMYLEVRAKKVRESIGDNGGEILLDYELYAEHAYLAKYHFVISVEIAEEK